MVVAMVSESSNTAVVLSWGERLGFQSAPLAIKLLNIYQ